MKNQELKDIAAKRIAETLELLEYGGMTSKEVGLIRKAMWRFFDEITLTKKVSANDKFNN